MGDGPGRRRYERESEETHLTRRSDERLGEGERVRGI